MTTILLPPLLFNLKVRLKVAWQPDPTCWVVRIFTPTSFTEHCAFDLEKKPNDTTKPVNSKIFFIASRF
jgi:hypothetical protein